MYIYIVVRSQSVIPLSSYITNCTLVVRRTHHLYVYCRIWNDELFENLPPKAVNRVPREVFPEKMLCNPLPFRYFIRVPLLLLLLDRVVFCCCVCKLVYFREPVYFISVIRHQTATLSPACNTLPYWWVNSPHRLPWRNHSTLVNPLWLISHKTLEYSSPNCNLCGWLEILKSWDGITGRE